MLPLPDFDLHRPAELSAALKLRADLPKARILAGGTDLLPSMKQGLFTPLDVIHIAGVPALYGVSVDAQGIRVGAMTSLRELGRDARVAKLAPGLVAACKTVATPTLQNMGTLGGNLLLDTRCRFYNQSQFWREALGAASSGAQAVTGCLKCDAAGICHIAPKGKGCYAAHSADTVPTLILLGAQAELASVRGTRRVPVEALYGEDGREQAPDRSPRLLIAPDEILVAVHIPTPTGPTVHRKVRARAAIDYPMLLVAASAEGVVLSSLGPRPQRVTGIKGSMLDADIDAVAQAAFSQAFPLATHVWASTWRKKMVRVEVRRALAELATLNGDPR